MLKINTINFFINGGRAFFLNIKTGILQDIYLCLENDSVRNTARKSTIPVLHCYQTNNQSFVTDPCSQFYKKAMALLITLSSPCCSKS